MSAEEGRTASQLSVRPFVVASLPALVVGVLAMRAADVPAGVWRQNVAAWVAGALLGVGISRVRRSFRWPGLSGIAAVLTLGALVTTLLTPGMDGVHRWVRLGPVRVHVAALLLPLLLVALERLACRRGGWVAFLVAVTAASALCLQPDAAQATAFVAAASVVLRPPAGRRARWLIGIASGGGIAALSWSRPDLLAAVPHVEEIVELTGRLWIGGTAVAIVSLLPLPAPFLLVRREGGPRAGMALAVYVSATVLATFVGHFPVPVMGYGFSPIIGYFPGVGAYLRVVAPRRQRHSIDRLRRPRSGAPPAE